MFFYWCQNLLGNDWECQLDSESRSSSGEDENVYGVNNLSYLRKQIKGYDTDADDDDSSENTDDSDEESLDEDDEHVFITMSNNGTVTFKSTSNPNSNFTSNSSTNSNVNANNFSNDFESSGDGEDPEEGNLENKSGYIPIPNNYGLITSQLQRLSQLVQNANQNQHQNQHHNAALTPNDFNQYLTLYKLIHQQFPSNNADPVPHHKLIEDHHLKQILDMQNKLNNLANTHNTYSTPPTPPEFTIEGDGVYPADATTVHIKATNTVKPKFPEMGYTSSQIVVNRPGGSVVFRMPNPNFPHKSSKKKQESQISEETLKTLLELSKQMSNNAPNTPNFVHSFPASTNGYMQPVVQPVVYNFPWDQLGLDSLLAILDAKKTEHIQNDEKSSMEKIATMSGSVPTTANAMSDPDDSGPTTIVHNHIPITITQPKPTNSIVNRIQSISTTMRPFEDRYDSYGHKTQSEHTDLNNYYSFPPYSENPKKISIAQQIPSLSGSAVIGYTSPFSTQATSYDHNLDQPQYVQISQSRPDHYVPVYPTNTIVSDTLRPIPTFASVDGGYTQKFYSTYSPQPHLGDANANQIVHINQKQNSMFNPVNYVPIATASSPTSSYADPPEHYAPVQKHQHIADKIDHFIDANDPSENDHTNENNENNDDYVNTNVEQSSNENVMDLLANYNSQIKPDPTKSINNSVEKKPPFKLNAASHHANHKQFVNLNGNFMSLETYEQSIEPYLQKNPELDAHIEILTCATGVRQANNTDCTRYFVCNEQTGKILSYSCPPHTAFNRDTKICNAETYSRCFSGISNKKHNKLSQSHISILEANRIKAEAVKAQQLAHLIRLETDKILSQAQQVQHKQQAMSGGKSTAQTFTSSRPVQEANNRPLHVPPNQTYRKPQSTQAPIVPQRKKNKNSARPAKKPRGKRKVPCKKEGKLVDHLSQHHYFLCFKDQRQRMKARRLQCPAKLLFCPSSLVCTATDRCMNKYNRL